MATWASQQRMERRRQQRARERRHADPQMIALGRYLDARARYMARHPWARHPALLRMWCMASGIRFGGRPPKVRRCTKRLGSRFCWNWRLPDTDRCALHAR